MPSLGREVVLGIRTAKVEDERRSLMAALQEAQLERDEPGTLLQPGRGCHARAGGITGSSFRLVDSVWGHYAWGITATETAQIEAIIAELLVAT